MITPAPLWTAKESASVVGDFTSWVPLMLLPAYPVYLLLMAAVLRVCGVPKREIARWVLLQAGRQRLTDLIRAARGLPAAPAAAPDEKP